MNNSRQHLPAYLQLGNLDPKFLKELQEDYTKFIEPKMEHFVQAGQTTEGLKYTNNYEESKFKERVYQLNPDLPYSGVNNYAVYPLTINNSTRKPAQTSTLKSDLSYKLMSEVHLNPNSALYDGSSDPKNFIEPNKDNPPSFVKLLRLFESYGLARSYLARLGPNTKIFEHIDADSTEYIKVHIPLISNGNNYLGVRYKKVLKTYPQEPGDIVFYNVGYPHFAANEDVSVYRTNIVLTFTKQSILLDYFKNVI
jgi:hypothetical protein